MMHKILQAAEALSDHAEGAYSASQNPYLVEWVFLADLALLPSVWPLLTKSKITACIMLISFHFCVFVSLYCLAEHSWPSELFDEIMPIYAIFITYS